MNDRETRRYDMFGRVQTFGKDNAGDFAAGSKATGHFAAVTQVINDLDTEKAKQGGGSAYIERAPKREKKPTGGTTPASKPNP
jgi:hypothetical protein